MREDVMSLNDRCESLELSEIEHERARRRNLAMLFQAITDDELIKELHRRNLQLDVNCSYACNNELAGLPQTQRTGSSIRQLLAFAIALGIAADPNLRHVLSASASIGDDNPFVLREPGTSSWITVEGQSRRLSYRKLLSQLDVDDPDTLVTQLALLVDGAYAAGLTHEDPMKMRPAITAAHTLLKAARVAIYRENSQGSQAFGP
jgi:hypothetical protein